MSKPIPVFTVEQIDNAMAEGERLLHLPFGEYDYRREDYPKAIGDWKVHLVNDGNGEHELIATPCGQRTRKIYSDGKIKRLSREYPELDPIIFSRYIHVARRQRYAMEHTVMDWVLRALKTITEADYRAIRYADNSFHEAASRGLRAGMSWPRFEAALNMVAGVLRIEI